MLITIGCLTDSTQPTKQLSLSATPPQQETNTTPTTDTEPSTLGSYYNSTVALLTDDCGVGAYSVATGKAVAYGIVGGLWGATEGSFYGVLSGASLEGLVIGSMVGSGSGSGLGSGSGSGSGSGLGLGLGLGLAVGVKDAYDGFKSDTSACSSS